MEKLGKIKPKSGSEEDIPEAVCENIDELVEDLRAREEKYRALFKQAGDSIVLADADTGEIVEFNDRAH